MRFDVSYKSTLYNWTTHASGHWIISFRACKLVSISFYEPNKIVKTNKIIWIILLFSWQNNTRVAATWVYVGVA